MRIAEFRAILREFAREAKQGRIIESAERVTLASLAENLEADLARLDKVQKIESTEISFAPNRCPCCGK